MHDHFPYGQKYGWMYSPLGLITFTAYVCRLSWISEFCLDSRYKLLELGE